MSASATTVKLGDGLVTSVQGYGAMGLTSVYGDVDDAAARRVLHHAIDAGVRLIDTADLYGGGDNERLVGDIARTRRDDVHLATKVGYLPAEDAEVYRFRGDPRHIAWAARASLERLGVDRIDLYYYHRVDPRVPIEETVGAMAELVTEGLVGHLGLSEVTASELERATSVHPIAAVQSEWSLWSRDVERSVVPAARRLGVGFVPYAPLGRGFLAGGLTARGTLDAGDLRRAFPRFEDANLRANAAIARTVADIAARLGITSAQLALAWLYARGRDLGIPVVPIPGTRRPERVNDNLAAAHIELDAETIALVDTVADAAVGSRGHAASGVSEWREQ